MQRAAKSCGVDRHLLGLRMLVQPHEKVPFFEDEAMQKSRYWRISTSHLTNELFDGWGWGEVVPEGYGIAYSIKNHSIQFNIAVKKPFTRGNEATKTTWSLLPGEQEFQWGERLGHLLQESLLEMAQLLITSQEDKKQEQPVSKL
jgi:carnitine O-acetyltransferase